MSVSDSTSTVEVEYQDVPDFPGYRVGSDGSVWSCWKKVGNVGRRGCHYEISSEWKPLVLNDSYGIYLRCGLHRGGKYHTRKVHKLVAMCFLGPCPNGLEVRHKDGVSTNNAVSNLLYGTKKQNMEDRDEHGTTARGERSGRAVLSEVGVVAMRSDHAAGEKSFATLGRKYGVSRRAAKCAVEKRTWKHVV